MNMAQEETTSSVAIDGFGALSGGMNSGLDPQLLSQSQYARGINVTTRGGLASTRPAFRLSARLGPGPLQGAGVLRLEGREHLLWASGGKVYCLRGGVPAELWGGLSPSAEFVHFPQVYRWIVAQDGTSRPAVFEEVAGDVVRVARDALLEPDSGDTRICLVPGTVGCYAHGRYHYVPTLNPELLPELEVDPADGTRYTDASLNAVPLPSAESGQVGFVSSDILDSLNPYKVFQMSEHRTLDEGGLASLPAEFGFVHGMLPMRGAASGTGMGAMYVFGSRGVSAFDVASPRSSDGGKGWKDIGFSQVAFSGIGTVSPFSLVSINDDIWYVDQNGEVRSLTYDASQMTQAGYASPALFNVSKSFEAARWTAATDKSYLPRLSAAHADNRFHWTLCGGDAVGSIDFAQTHSANPSEIPILHEGVWTGFRVERVLALGGLLAYVASEGGELFLLETGGEKDLGRERIRSELVTREMPGWYNEQMTWTWWKKLAAVELHLSGISMPTSVQVYFRPSGWPAWTLLGEKSLYVKEGTPPQSRVVEFKPNYATAEECDPVTKRSLYFSRAFQFKIVWTGRATIRRFVSWAQRMREAPTWQCEQDNPDGAEFPPAELVRSSDFGYSVVIGEP